MKKLFLIPMFLFISRNALGDTCEFNFENTMVDFCEIIKKGNLDCLKVFIEKNPNLLNQKLGNTSTVHTNYRPQRGDAIQVITNDYCSGETPLTFAAKWHDLPMMKMLINAGADINGQNDSGNTALMISVSRKYSYYISEIDYITTRGILGFISELRNMDPSAAGTGTPLSEKNPVLRLEEAKRTDIDLENYLTYNTLLRGGKLYDDVVNYLLDNGADANVLNKFGQNALYISVSDAPSCIDSDTMKKLLNKTKFNDLVAEDTITASAYCIDAHYHLHDLIKAGYDINKTGTDGKSMCDKTSFDDFIAFGCKEFECTQTTKGKILPCAIPNGAFDWVNCIDKTYGTKICDGTNWSECTFERGDNKCRHGWIENSYCYDGKCCGTDKEDRKNIADGEFTKKYDIEKSQEKNSTVKSQQPENTMKDKEQSMENKLLGAAGMGLTGAGLSKALSASAEQKADEAAELDMVAYLATMHCNYAPGKNVQGGEKEVELPGANSLLPLYTEYVALANDLKIRKEALDMQPGIESEAILDGATSGLYDDVALGN